MCLSFPQHAQNGTATWARRMRRPMTRNHPQRSLSSRPVPTGSARWAGAADTASALEAWRDVHSGGAAVFFSTLKMLDPHHLWSSSRTFLSPQRETPVPRGSHSPALLLWPLAPATTNLSVSGFACSGSFTEPESHNTSGLSHSQPDIFQAHLRCRPHISFVPLYGPITFHCMDGPHCVHPSNNGHLGCVRVGVVVSSAALLGLTLEPRQLQALLPPSFVTG